MRNRSVGILVILIALLMGYITFSFNQALTDIVSTSCTHGDACPMWGTIDFQTSVSLALMAVVFLVGLYLVFFGREERIVEKTIVKKVPAKKGLTKEQKEDIRGLRPEEKKVFEIVRKNGTIFQSELSSQAGMGKVKISRILDRLEGRRLIERKRRGMTNVVVLKE